MASAEEVYRESQKRLHKTLGAYLLVKAWSLKVDGIALQRNTLLNFLSLERMKNVRIDWLKEDISEYFPHQWVTHYSGSKTYATLYLSRFELPKKSKIGAMKDEKRIELMKEENFNCKIVETIEMKEIISSMALFANGLLAPQNIK